MIYFIWIIAVNILNEVLSYLFTNLPINLQFLVAFMIAMIREADERLRTKLVNKMMGKLDESATALLTVSISSHYSFFIAIRLVGASFETICCFVLIELGLHSGATYKIIKKYGKVNDGKLVRGQEIEDFI